MCVCVCARALPVPSCISPERPEQPWQEFTPPKPAPAPVKGRRRGPRNRRAHKYSPSKPLRPDMHEGPSPRGSPEPPALLPSLSPSPEPEGPSAEPGAGRAQARAAQVSRSLPGHGGGGLLPIINPRAQHRPGQLVGFQWDGSKEYEFMHHQRRRQEGLRRSVP